MIAYAGQAQYCSLILSDWTVQALATAPGCLGAVFWRSGMAVTVLLEGIADVLAMQAAGMK